MSIIIMLEIKENMVEPESAIGDAMATAAEDAADAEVAAVVAEGVAAADDAASGEKAASSAEAENAAADGERITGTRRTSGRIPGRYRKYREEPSSF